MTLALDRVSGGGGGSVNCVGTGPNSGPFTVPLETANAEDVLILVSINDTWNKGLPQIGGYGSGAPLGASGVTDTSSLVWTRRSITQTTWPAGVLAIGLTLEVWWAFSPAAYNGTITINYPNDGITTQGVDNYALLAFGVSGAGNPRSPWDVNASLPDPDTHYYGDYRGTLAALDMVPSLSTTAPNSFIFVVGGAVPGSSLSFSANALADVTDGYVDTNLPAGAFEGGQSVSLMSEYLIAGAPQVALTPNFAYAGDTWCMIADAISGAGAAGAARRVFFVA